MPDIDRLMEVWPEEFEKLLTTTSLPSPDLELSVAEYAKVLCSILDIPMYDNPVESLHLMFSLYLEFKNNPHFQSRMISTVADGKDGSKGDGNNNNNNSNNNNNMGNRYGGADVLEITSPDYK